MSADKPTYASPVDLTATYEKYGKKASEALPPSSLAEFGIAYRIVKAGDHSETRKPSCGLGPNAERSCNYN